MSKQLHPCGIKIHGEHADYFVIEEGSNIPDAFIQVTADPKDNWEVRVRIYTTEAGWQAIGVVGPQTLHAALTVLEAREAMPVRGQWLTNHPKSIKGYWPRRAVPLVEGPPQGVSDTDTADCEEAGYVGIYLADFNMTRNQSKEFKLCYDHQEWVDALVERYEEMRLR